LILLHDAEEVSVRVLEDDKVGCRARATRITLRTECDETLEPDI